jgi:dihydroflavonol-4-reductase
MREATHVFHLAGPLLVPGVSERVYTETHIEGTRNVLTACVRNARLQAIVHCSTTGVLGVTGPTPQSEDAPYNPSNIYERSKMEGEKLALDYARREGLPLSVARPALVYGPGDVHLLGWFRAIQRGYYAIIGRGDNPLHPIYIDDLVDGLRRCAVPAAVGRVYHLVGERPVPIGELANAIAQAMGRGPLWHMPVSIAQFAATVFEALPVDRARLPLTHQRLQFMMQSRAYRGARARTELGFAPRTDLASGLRHAVAWYRAEGLL